MSSATDHTSKCKALSRKPGPGPCPVIISNRGAQPTKILHITFNPIRHVEECSVSLFILNGTELVVECWIETYMCSVSLFILNGTELVVECWIETYMYLHQEVYSVALLFN
jgi:hypothetical protein